MPAVPLPQAVPIEHNGWNTDFSGNVQLPNSERSPVNPIMSGLGQAATQAQTGLQTAQTAKDVNEVQQKQREMALSMINAAASDPDPEKAQSKLSSIIPIVNRLSPSFQVDPNIDVGTARTLAMGGVPTEQQPTYALNQSNAAINMALLKALGGAPAASGGMQGAPEAPNVQPAAPNISPTGQIAAPSSPPQEGMMSPQAEALLALARPEASKALQGTPLYKQQVAASETSGKNTAEAQKSAIEANEGYQQVAKTIESLKELIKDPSLPQATDVRDSKTKALISQRFGDQKEANAYNTFQTLNESQTINAIRDLASTGQIKMTRTLENIINKGYLIDPDASPEAKLAQANAIEVELKNSAAAAQNISAKMGGGKIAPYESPLTAADQAKEKMQPKQNFTNAPKPGAIEDGYVYTGGDPSKPESWKATK